MLLTCMCIFYVAMGSLAIMVLHSGRWDDENRYVDYTLEGIVFKESSTYTELIMLIAK